MSFKLEKTFTFPSKDKMLYPDTLLSTTRGAEAAWEKVVDYLADQKDTPGIAVNMVIGIVLTEWKDLKDYPVSIQKIAAMSLEAAIEDCVIKA
jgi:hypothetical protein